MSKIKYLYLIQGFLYLMFFYLSKGLIYFNDERGDYGYVTELLSSGSDDNNALFATALVCLFGFIFMFFKKLNSKQMVYFVAVILLFQIFSIVLIEVGSIRDTIINEMNAFLIAGFTCQLLIFGVISKILLSKKLV